MVFLGLAGGFLFASAIGIFMAWRGIADILKNPFKWDNRIISSEALIYWGLVIVVCGVIGFWFFLGVAFSALIK